MEVLFFVLVTTALMSIPIWGMLVFIRKTYFWDYGISFYGIIPWVVLTYFNIGGVSLTNAFLEPIYINGIAICLVLIRFFLSKYTKTSNKFMSIISILLVIVFAILIKFIIPTLPE